MNDEQLKRAFRAMVAPNTDADDWRKFSSAMTQTANERTGMYVHAIKERDAALAERDALQVTAGDRLVELVAVSAERDALAAEVARLREAVTRARVRIQEHLDMGLETRCPDDCDPEHDFGEMLADLDEALAARALVEAPR